MAITFTQETLDTITLPVTYEAMKALIVPGKQPNGKLAYWSAALSVRNRLSNNCYQATVMREYVNKPLPADREALRAQLAGRGPLLNRTLNTLYEIEKLWNAGVIHFNCGHTFEEQAAWRSSMCAAIPGMGMKTLSFALHIYDPFGCLLLAIDCWHLRRVGAENESIKAAQYLQYEKRIRFDCVMLDLEESTISGGYPVVVLAACLWERTRHAFGASKSVGYQEHSGLSCYV